MSRFRHQRQDRIRRAIITLLLAICFFCPAFNIAGNSIQLSNPDTLSKSLLNASDSLFSSYWDTNQIYAYLSIKNKEKYGRELILTDSLHSRFVLPVYGKINRGYTSYHAGLDISLNLGDTVVAAFDGKVRYAKYHPNGYGNLVIIRHFNGLETYYSHLSKILVKSGDEIDAGKVVGLGGSTGRATCNHLHFETRYLDRSFDPLNIIDFENRKLAVNSYHPFKNFKSSGELQLADDSDAKYHRIVKGDTLSEIAMNYGTSVKKICQMNNMSKKTKLKIGKKLRVK